MPRSPIFVVGAPRSGTTLLWRLLNAHPQVHLTFEASFFNLAKAVPARMRSAEFRDAWTASLPFAWQRVADLDAAAPHGLPARDPRYFEALMTHCAEVRGKTRWGDKSPAHVYEVGALLDAFPDARVVHIVRDPVAVVRSLHSVPWAGVNLFANALTVRLALDAVEPFRSRIHEVRLEALVDDRSGVMQGVLDFCGLPWDDAVLAPSTSTDTPPVPWLVTRTALRQNLPARPALSPEDAYRVSRITAPQRARYGYEPLPHAGRSLWGHLARAATDVRELWSVGWSLLALRRVLKRRPRPSSITVFDAVNALHPDAVLACTPADRQRLIAWLRTPVETG